MVSQNLKGEITAETCHVELAGPLVTTNPPAMASIRVRRRTPASTASRYMSTHIAQGLKPSMSPSATVNSGSPRRLALSDPNSGTATASSAAESVGQGVGPRPGTPAPGRQVDQASRSQAQTLFGCPSSDG